MAPGAAPRAPAAVAGLFAACCAAAYLSHTSTFAILSVARPWRRCRSAWRGGAALRPPALAASRRWPRPRCWRWFSTTLHFLETYRTELARIGHETATAAPTPAAGGSPARLGSCRTTSILYFGLPALLLAAWRRVAAPNTRACATRSTLTVDRLDPVLRGSSCVIGVLTPVDMRYYLAALPVVAITAAAGAAHGWAPAACRAPPRRVLLAWSAGNRRGEMVDVGG